MNAQLSEQLKQWKAEEWNRTVRRYAEANHDPSAPENSRRLGSATPAYPAPNTVTKKTFSWYDFSKFMGVKSQDLYALGATHIRSRTAEQPGTAH